MRCSLEKATLGTSGEFFRTFSTHLQSLSQQWSSRLSLRGMVNDVERKIVGRIGRKRGRAIGRGRTKIESLPRDNGIEGLHERISQA